MANRLYAFYRDGNAKLYPSFVVFADLLGTSQKIRESDEDTELRLLNEIVEALDSAAHFIEDREGLTSVIRYYSDCVSIVTPAINDGPFGYCESSFGFTVPSLLMWQAEMVRRGVFVRGGLAFGNVYVDDHSLFGKAHLEAYSLETKRAIHPRIILDENTIELAKLQVTSYAKDFPTPHESELLVDNDDEVFLHYLSVYSEEEHEEGNPDLAEELLRRHAELVTAKIADAADEHIRAKYEWVAGYHNWFCDQNWSQSFDTRSHRVPGDSSSFRNFREWVNCQ